MKQRGVKSRAWRLAVPVSLLAACSHEPPTVGADVAFAQVCNKANEGKRVAVVGYLRLPARLKSNDTSPMLRFYDGAAFDTRHIIVSVPVGRGPNQVENPLSRAADGSLRYSDEDLKVHLANSAVATVGTKVKVSGEMYIPMVPQTGPDGFACGLTNPLIESAP